MKIKEDKKNWVLFCRDLDILNSGTRNCILKRRFVFHIPTVMNHFFILIKSDIPNWPPGTLSWYYHTFLEWLIRTFVASNQKESRYRKTDFPLEQCQSLRRTVWGKHYSLFEILRIIHSQWRSKLSGWEGVMQLKIFSRIK